MKLKYTVIFMLGALSLCSCSDSEPETVRSRAAFSMSGRSQQDAVDNELIHDWWVILSQNGRVAAVASGTEGGVDHKDFAIDVNAGTYDAYGFANISREELASALGIGGSAFEVGGTLPAGFDSRSVTMPAVEDPGYRIPMSGSLKGIRITGRAQESFDIEVVRMMGKIEFEFSNMSASDIEVLGVTFGPVMSGPVYMLPVGVPGIPSILECSRGESRQYTFGEPAYVPQGAVAAARRHFYVRETVSGEHPTDKFHFSVQIRRDGQPGEELFALTEDLTWISRNDYIQVPVSFLDWSLIFDCRFAPPIGGYPAVLIEVKNYEYYIKFGSAGRFMLSPLVKKGAGGDYLSPDRLQFDVVSLDDPQGILDGDLRYDGNGVIVSPVRFEDGIIVGNLTDRANSDGSPRVGRAGIEMTVRVREAGLDHVFRRKFYIIREKL